MDKTEQRIEQIEQFASQCYEDGENYSAFISGAIWADKHPKNVWHASSEKPKYGEDIIAIDIDGISVAGIYNDYNGNGIYRYHCFLCEWDSVVKWSYVSDILPKGGEK